jgi:hypothetical protein
MFILVLVGMVIFFLVVLRLLRMLLVVLVVIMVLFLLVAMVLGLRFVVEAMTSDIPELNRVSRSEINVSHCVKGFALAYKYPGNLSDEKRTPECGSGVKAREGRNTPTPRSRTPRTGTQSDCSLMATKPMSEELPSSDPPPDHHDAAGCRDLPIIVATC